jgi:hypothetical protein
MERIRIISSEFNKCSDLWHGYKTVAVPLLRPKYMFFDDWICRLCESLLLAQRHV